MDYFFFAINPYRLASAHSACPSRAAEGRLGQIATGDTVREFEAALDRLHPGEILPEPVETHYGLHVPRLDAREPGKPLPFDKASPSIREMQEKTAWADEAKRFVARLAARAQLSGVDFAHAAGRDSRSDRISTLSRRRLL